MAPGSGTTLATSRSGSMFTIVLALGAIVLAVILALVRRARPAVPEPGRVRPLRLLHVVLPGHAADRPALPDLLRASADRGEPRAAWSLVNVLTLDGVPGRRHRARAELRRVHDRDLPRRDPVGRSRPGRGGRCPRHVLRASGCGGSCCRRRTRVIIPPTGNEFIAMMKDTALVGFLGVELAQAELFRRAHAGGQPGPPEARVVHRGRRDVLGPHRDLHVLPGAAGAPDVEGLRAGGGANGHADEAPAGSCRPRAGADPGSRPCLAVDPGPPPGHGHGGDA